MSSIISRRRDGGIDKIALRFPSGALKGAGAALSSAMSEAGRIVPPATADAAAAAASRTWSFENVIQDGEGALLVGPGFEGESLDEVEGLERGMPLLLAVARALRSLSAESSLPRGLVSAGIIAGADGVLVLPPVAAARALAAAGTESRARAVARFSSPLSDGPESDASFLIAQAAYRLAAGEGAFAVDPSEPGGLVNASRRGLSAALAVPRLDPGLASAIDAALADPRRVSLAAWIAALEKAEAAHWIRDLSAEETAASGSRAEAARAEAARRRKRADFWRRRGGIVAAAAVALAVVGLVLGDMARAQKSKPDFSALAPLELARRYYTAVDAIDLEALDACVGRKVKIDSSYVTNLTVLTKTRMAYEGKNPLRRAADWVAAGKPALPESDMLYGVVGLELVDEGGGPDRVSCRATYSFWAQEKDDDPPGDPSKALSVPVEERRVDELVLERGKKGGWKIASLERRVLSRESAIRP
jgi:hypothetical protein